jgi:peptidoglycan hydrolase CwlO-like protein
MKKLFVIIFCCFATMSAMAATHIPASSNLTSDSLILIRIEDRVADIQSEIQSLDVQHMSIEEKHSLRSEVRIMMQQLKSTKSYRESKHPYRVGAISSTGVLAVILYVLYFTLKCI